MAVVFRRAYIHAAEVAGNSAEMDATARMVLRKMKAAAAKHRLTGETLRSIHIETSGNGKDRLVVADGEGVVPIEFGYARMIKVAGSVVIKYMPGLKIFRNAFDSIPGRTVNKWR
jgi:hypothetical protein